MWVGGKAHPDIYKQHGLAERLDLLQKSIFSCRGEAFAPRFIGEIRVFIRKCFDLFGFMQEVY
jgi:hypothetical protein